MQKAGSEHIKDFTVIIVSCANYVLVARTVFLRAGEIPAPFSRRRMM